MTTPDLSSPCSQDSACCSSSSPCSCRQAVPPALTASESVERDSNEWPSRTTSESVYSGAKSAVVRTLTPHRDNRGNVRETFRASWFPEVPPIRQLVRSKSKPKTLRGMHLHRKQWDIWHFVRGFALVRLYYHQPDPRWGALGTDEFIWAGPDTTIAIPPGVSHGFYTPDGCTLLYALTEEYDGSDEFGWHWSDGVGFGEFADEWPGDPSDLNISERDLRAPRLAEFGG